MDYREHHPVNNTPRHKAKATSRKKKHKVARRQRTAQFNYKDPVKFDDTCGACKGKGSTGEPPITCYKCKGTGKDTYV